MKTRIKELRARFDLTQEDLAKKVGVRRETILFIEKGNYNPSLQLAHDIAKALQRQLTICFYLRMNNTTFIDRKVYRQWNPLAFPVQRIFFKSPVPCLFIVLFFPIVIEGMNFNCYIIKRLAAISAIPKINPRITV
jgi:putative transcriptional regulator